MLLYILKRLYYYYFKKSTLTSRIQKLDLDLSLQAALCLAGLLALLVEPGRLVVGGDVVLGDHLLVKHAIDEALNRMAVILEAVLLCCAAEHR